MIEHDVTVDIGLTAYRRATYICEAIESVIAQTHTSWELAICDNGIGSSEVEDAVKPYLSDPRVSYRPTGRDLSLSENWTTALNLGSGPYVAVLNDDDRWHPDFLEARVKALEAHPDCGFAFSGWVDINADGVVTDRSTLRFAEGVVSRNELADVLVHENPVVPPAIVLRRAACEAVGAYFGDTFQYCDWELWARIVTRFPAYYLARRDNDYRRHGTNYTYENREAPAQLLAMSDHIVALFSSEVEGFRLSRIDRARNRSGVLLNAAFDVHWAGGWKASGPTYRRAIREYPPTFVSRKSLKMVANSLLGKRGTRAVASVLQTLRRTWRGLARSRPQEDS